MYPRATIHSWLPMALKGFRNFLAVLLVDANAAQADGSTTPSTNSFDCLAFCDARENINAHFFRDSSTSLSQSEMICHQLLGAARLRFAAFRIPCPILLMTRFSPSFQPLTNRVSFKLNRILRNSVGLNLPRATYIR